MIDYGKYVEENIPRFVQETQVTHNNELEILIHPEGMSLILMDIITLLFY